MADLEDTINQAISDFDDIEKAIEEQGVDVPYDTNTSQYGNLIRGIKTGGDVDQTFNAESANAQSGIAVDEAIKNSHIKYVESLDTDNLLDLFSMESGTYILMGKFRPYPEANNAFTFSKKQLVSISKGSVSTCVQVFYPPYNAIQYLNILPPDEEAGTGYTYERKDAKLYYMEDTRNMTNTVDENSDDTHYPSAKAVYDAMELKRIESLDENNMKYMRDIEDGYYIMHGYFKPYPNSKSTVIMDTMCVSVVRKEEGSHLMAFSPLNFKVRCYEILVDDTAADGFVFNSWVINLLELQELETNKMDKFVVTIDSDSLIADKSYDEIMTALSISNEVMLKDTATGSIGRVMHYDDTSGEISFLIFKDYERRTFTCFPNNSWGSIEGDLGDDFVFKSDYEKDIGKIETALDSIISIQNTLIGGETA